MSEHTELRLFAEVQRMMGFWNHSHEEWNAIGSGAHENAAADSTRLVLCLLSPILQVLCCAEKEE